MFLTQKCLSGRLSVHYRSLRENTCTVLRYCKRNSLFVCTIHIFSTLTVVSKLCRMKHVVAGYEYLEKKSTLVSYSILRNYTKGLVCDFPGNILQFLFRILRTFFVTCLHFIMSTACHLWRDLPSSAPKWKKNIMISWHGNSGIPNYLTRIRGQ